MFKQWYILVRMGSRTCLRFIKREVLSKSRSIFPQLCGQRLSSSESILNLPLSFISLSFLCFEGLCVYVLSAFAGLSTNLRASFNEYIAFWDIQPTMIVRRRGIWEWGSTALNIVGSRTSSGSRSTSKILILSYLKPLTEADSTILWCLLRKDVKIYEISFLSMLKKNGPLKLIYGGPPWA